MRSNPLRSERGQGAAEYMGVLLLVAVIVAGVIASNLDKGVVGAGSNLVDGGRKVIGASNPFG
jgi:hypothetical protein